MTDLLQRKEARHVEREREETAGCISERTYLPLLCTRTILKDSCNTIVVKSNVHLGWSKLGINMWHLKIAVSILGLWYVKSMPFNGFSDAFWQLCMEFWKWIEFIQCFKSCLNLYCSLICLSTWLAWSSWFSTRLCSAFPRLGVKRALFVRLINTGGSVNWWHAGRRNKTNPNTAWLWGEHDALNWLGYLVTTRFCMCQAGPHQ